MSRIDQIKEMVAKARIPKALKELRALTEQYGLQEDYENELVALQSRHSSYKNNEQMGLMDTNSLNLERNRLIAAINYYITNIEDDLPEEAFQEEQPANSPTPSQHQTGQTPPIAAGPATPESRMTPEEALAKEIDILAGNISHNTKKLEFLRNKLIIESNPSTQFNLETEIEKAEKELDEDRERLAKLKQS